jgi:hypothetical protein
MARWQWTVNGVEDRYGQSKGFTATDQIEAECGEEALHQLLAQIPGPWDELDSDEEFTVTIRPC